MRESVRRKLPSNASVIIHTLIALIIYLYTLGRDTEMLGNIILGIRVLYLGTLLTIHLIERHKKY